MEQVNTLVEGFQFNHRIFGLALGIFCFFVMLNLNMPEGLSITAQRTIAVATLMIIFWIFEPIPIAVTALLPLLLLPTLGISNFETAAAPYSDPLIFLFLGGFMLALAMQKWGLHLRIALYIISITGSSANGIIAGFMLATAALSMWISNTATAALMLPIGISIINFLSLEDHIHATAKQRHNFALCLMLGIAYASSIGGIATLVGTPPNALMAAFFHDHYQTTVSFAKWMSIGLPFVLLMLPITFFLLNYIIYPNKIGRIAHAKQVIENEKVRLGPISNAEKKVTIIFLVTAILWIFRSPINSALATKALSDPLIAILATVLLFIVPPSIKDKHSLLSWEDTKDLPWGIILLFGGGISLASALSSSGVVEYLGNIISSFNFPSKILVILVTSAIVLLLTEVMSNLALITVFLPILASIALGFGIEPAFIIIPATIAASCAFTMPIATPPNAIVFASGHVRIIEMAKAGIILNLVALLIILLLYYSGLLNF